MYVALAKLVFMCFDVYQSGIQILILRQKTVQFCFRLTFSPTSQGNNSGANCTIAYIERTDALIKYKVALFFYGIKLCTAFLKNLNECILQFIGGHLEKMTIPMVRFCQKFFSLHFNPKSSENSKHELCSILSWRLPFFP